MQIEFYGCKMEDWLNNKRKLPPPALLRTAWRSLLRRPWQTGLMILGITLGVAVVASIDIANGSALQGFALSTQAVVGKATHQILGGPGGIEESVYFSLRSSDLDFAIAPVLTEYVTVEQLGNAPIQLMGVDPFAETPFRDYVPSPVSGRADEDLTAFFTEPGAVLLASSLAERYNLQKGDRLDLELSGRRIPAVIAGTIEPPDTIERRALEGILLADIATSQELTGNLGRLTQIDLILPQDDLQAISEIEQLLPQGLRLQATSARSGAVQEMTAAFQLNLTALSLLALVVGIFLIYNTMTFSIVQRRSFFGTLRCLGITGQEIFVLVIVEGLSLGMIGSILGLVTGVLLGREMVNMVTQTISDLFFVVTVRSVAIPWSSLFKAMLLGVVATVLAALAPAREAASVPARAALSRSGLETRARHLVGTSAISGVVLMLLGLGLLWLPGRSLGLAFGGTFAIVIGVALLTPFTALGMMRISAPLLGRVNGLIGRMAARNVIRSLSRTSIAIAALMVAVSVTIGISLMISSFRHTVEIWLGQTLQGDVYISPPSLRANGSTSVLAAETLRTLETWPGVEQLDLIRSVQVESSLGSIQLGATNNPGPGGERIYKYAIGTPQQVREAMQAGAILVSEPLAVRLELEPPAGRARPGETAADLGEMVLFTSRGPASFPIAGIYYDYASTQGSALIDLATYQSHWDDLQVSAAGLRLATGLNPEEVTRDLQSSLLPIQQLSIRPNRTLRAEALAVFDRTFAITTALQLLATIVAFFGILSALLSLQIDKQRETATLRALGITMQQVRRLALFESGLMGTIAGLLAMPTGFVLAIILIYIINRRAFGWTLLLQIPPEPFVQAMGIALAAALLAGLIPARRVRDLSVAEALRGD